MLQSHQRRNSIALLHYCKNSTFIQGETPGRDSSNMCKKASQWPSGLVSVLNAYRFSLIFSWKRNRTENTPIKKRKRWKATLLEPKTKEEKKGEKGEEVQTVHERFDCMQKYQYQYVGSWKCTSPIYQKGRKRARIYIFSMRKTNMSLISLLYEYMIRFSLTEFRFIIGTENFVVLSLIVKTRYFRHF